MAVEFVLVISTHRKLGDLLIPYLVERKNGQSFFQLTDVLSIDNMGYFNFEFTDEQKKIIEITSGYSEKVIYKNYCSNKNIKLKEFFDTLDEKLIESQIRPYCERRIAKCIELLVQSDTKIYYKEKKYQVVHDDEQLKVQHVPIDAVFNFSYNQNGLKYWLTLQSQNNTIKLFNKNYSILSNQPLIIILDHTIYTIRDIDSKKIIPFFKKDFIEVPAKNLKNYLTTFVKNTIARYPVKTFGFNIEISEPSGNCILNLEPDLEGNPAFNVKFKYLNVIFDYQLYPDPSIVEYVEKPDGTFLFHKIIRNESWENQMIQKLINYGFVNKMGSFFKLKTLEGSTSSQLYEMINWLNFHSEALKNDGFIINLSNTYANYYTSHIVIETKIEEGIDWFDIKTMVVLDQFTFPFVRFKKHILEQKREFELPNGKIIILPENWFTDYRDIFIFGSTDTQHVRLKKYHFPILNNSITSQANVAIDKLKENLSQSAFNENILPTGLDANLRDYQKKGFYWMYRLYQNRLGGCLADDMGLGKTLQTIALLLKIKEETTNKEAFYRNNEMLNNTINNGNALFTSLIIMPVSLLHNWENEFQKFAPTLSIYKYVGAQRLKTKQELEKYDVILTSYGVLRNDVDYLKDFEFKYIILDESQLAKNPDSKIYKALLQLKAENRLVLTGTPIENSLIDLWAQMNFLNRGLLLNLQTFKNEFQQPIENLNDEEKKQKLKFLISPFILRRKKEEVVKELPQLIEQTLFCDMTDDQRDIYEKEKSAARNLILEAIDYRSFEKSSIIILKMLNRLRLLSNHPRLVDDTYTGDSGKYDEITRSIENVVSEGHKVLIFSSYVKHLNLIAEYLRNNHLAYSLLTGSTQNRSAIIDEFQHKQLTNIFLISLKAGGTGLNLTEADYVFILDPWWNPASENQAISRAHRIGQAKNVFVYRFISSDTIEEKIQTLQQKKKNIADAFINSNNPFKMLEKDDIIELFN